MFNSNNSNRLFGRTRGRSKKKIDLTKYYQTVAKYKFQNFNKKVDYILDIGTGYGETSIFLAKKFPEKVVTQRLSSLNSTTRSSRSNPQVLQEPSAYTLKDIRIKEQLCFQAAS